MSKNTSALDPIHPDMGEQGVDSFPGMKRPRISGGMTPPLSFGEREFIPQRLQFPGVDTPWIGFLIPSGKERTQGIPGLQVTPLSRRHGNTPLPATASPTQSFVTLPRNTASGPHRYGSAPQSSALGPQSAVAALPTSTAALPSAVTALPSSTAALPSAVTALPSSYRCAPKRCDSAPKLHCCAPKRCDSAPKLHRCAPKRCDGAPQHSDLSSGFLPPGRRLQSPSPTLVLSD